jgi:DNA-binding beta-propeller fold protein YncE
MSKNHFFNVNDINSNGLLDFVFIDNQKLIVIDENGKKLFTEKFKSAITNYPNIYTFSPKEKKIGVVNQSENRIYLFGPDGNLHQGFPLHGNSEFSIGKINSGSNYLNLIVGSNDENIYNYRL